MHLTAGQTYTWLITSGASLTFTGSFGDAYAGGRSNADLNSDWAFRTYMGGRPNVQVAGVLTVSESSVLNGSVGVGTSNMNGYKFFVNGAAGGTTTWNSLSDARYKSNVATFPDALDAILNLRGVTFDWKQNEFADRNFADGKQIGFIAQEVEKVLPEIVTTDQKGYKSVAYANVVPVLVEAMKQQQEQITEQQKQIDILKRRTDRTDSLAAENAALKQQLDDLAETIRQIKAAQDAFRLSPLPR